MKILGLDGPVLVLVSLVLLAVIVVLVRKAVRGIVNYMRKKP